MGKASNFNSVREKNLYFFGGGGNEKLPKTDFFRKTLMSKLTSRRIWKCIIYEGYGDFCASYYPSKSAHGGKSESVPIIMRRQKKDTATIMRFERCHWISVEPTMLGPCWFNGGAQNSKLWPCLFFWHLLSSEFFLKFSPNFDSQ